MKKNKILFVEDEKMLRETLQEALEDNKFDVSTAINGNEALELLKDNQYELILLDIILPKVNGLEVLQKIRDAGDKTPVILLTNLSGPNHVQKALDLGARNYLVKSEYRLDEIVDRVKEVIK